MTRCSQSTRKLLVLSPLSNKGALPVTVEVSGSAFPIAHDFRDGILFERLIHDRKVPDGTKLTLALGIWYGDNVPRDVKGAIDAMLWFHRCGKQPVEVEGAKQSFSFAQDWDSIFAGFLSVYGIDLLDEDTHLHWWKFRSMLQALPETTQFMQILGYRNAKITSGMSDDQKAHIRKMQRIYALQDSGYTVAKKIRTEEELKAVLAEIKRIKREGAQNDT